MRLSNDDLDAILNGLRNLSIETAREYIRSLVTEVRIQRMILFDIEQLKKEISEVLDEQYTDD